MASNKKKEKKERWTDPYGRVSVQYLIDPEIEEMLEELAITEYRSKPREMEFIIKWYYKHKQEDYRYWEKFKREIKRKEEKQTFTKKYDR